MIYLDHAATTPVALPVQQAVLAAMQEAWQNPSAVYRAAGHARKQLRLARETLAEMVACDPAEVFFTSGGTESNTWALSLARGKHAVVSAIEHASVLEAARHFAAEVTLVEPDASGVVQPESVLSALRPGTALVSVQWANNETGVIQPVEALGKALKKRRIPFHVDAVQAVGHVPVNFAVCDLMSLSAHKFYGPKGIGCLIARMGKEPPPLLWGGGQEGGLRSGTENVPAICGLRAACELAQADMAQRAAREKALLSAFDVPGARVLGQNVERLPGVLALLLPRTSAEIAIAALDQQGIQISGGAACASRSHQASHVYRAMGLTEAEALRVIRLSVGRDTTAADLHAARDALIAL